MKPCRWERPIVIEWERQGRRSRIERFLLQGKKQRRPVSSGLHLQLVCTAA